MRFARPSALTEGLGDAAAFYHVHSFAPRPADDDDRARPRRLRRAVRLDRRAGHVSGCSSTPRSPRPQACACSRTSRGCCAAVPRVILYPAIDISEGQAVRLRQGDFGEKTVYRDSPLEAARAWVHAGARFLHVVDLDGARTGTPHALEHLERITQRAVGARAVRGRPALAARGARRAAGGGRAGHPRHRRLHRRRLPRRRHGRLPRARDRVASTPATGTSRPRAGSRRRRCRPTAVIERLQNRGVRSFVYTNVDRDGMLGGPDLGEVQRIAAVVRGRFLYSGGIGSLRDLRGARGPAPGQPRRRHRRQGALRGALHDRRGPARARGLTFSPLPSERHGAARVRRRSSRPRRAPGRRAPSAIATGAPPIY